MDDSGVNQLVERHKRLLAVAQRSKGKTVRNRPTRDEVLESIVPLRVPFLNFIDPAYLPSLKPLSQLRPMKIANLKTQTHHRGKVLYVRTISDAVARQGIVSVVEDEHGGVDVLEANNQDPALQIDAAIPKGAVFAIKEPFYSISEEFAYIIRVDHPSDLIHLQPTDKGIPVAFATRPQGSDASVTDWKIEGNAAIAAKDYLTALQKYTTGLSSPPSADTMLQYDLYRNRALVNLHFNRPEAAHDDAINSIVPPELSTTPQTIKNNAKAWYRAGRASYQLGHFALAKEEYTNASNLSPEDAAVINATKCVMERLAEFIKGQYDFAAMAKAAEKGGQRLDHASFTHHVAVRSSPGHGKGLFATKAIAAGELILCEKAFDLVFAREGPYAEVGYNLNTANARAGRNGTLAAKLVHKLRHNPGQAERLLSLYCGGARGECRPQLVDGVAAIDAFHVHAAVDYNAFACSERSSLFEAQPRGGAKTAAAAAEAAAAAAAGAAVGAWDLPLGVWLTASYINNACSGNAARAFMGDMMVVRAVRAIAAGEEITMHYRIVDSDHAAHFASLQEIWKFDCDCSLCAAEARVSPMDKFARAALNGEVAAFLSARPGAPREPPQEDIQRARGLYRQLEATYDEQIFRGRARFDLVKLSAWICAASTTHTEAGDWPPLVISFLRDVGIIVKVEDDSVAIDSSRRLDIATTDVLRAVIMARYGYIARRQSHGAERFRELLKHLYTLAVGTSHGLESFVSGGNADS